MPKRLDPTAKTAGQIRQMFEAIAPRYDLLNHLLSAGLDRRWRKVAVDLALRGAAPRDARVLDVCCGTGDLALAFARDARVREVVGVDFAPAMLRRAEAKPGPVGGPPLRWLAGDALHLPLESAARFDVVSIAFGLRNLVDPAAGVAGFAERLRPGGRLVILEFFQPVGGWLASAFRLYFHRVLPRLGRLVSGPGQAEVDAYRYLPDSVDAFAAPDGVVEWMESAGVHRVQKVPMALGAVVLFIAECVNRNGPSAPPAEGESRTGNCG